MWRRILSEAWRLKGSCYQHLFPSPHAMHQGQFWARICHPEMQSTDYHPFHKWRSTGQYHLPKVSKRMWSEPHSAKAGLLPQSHTASRMPWGLPSPTGGPLLCVPGLVSVSCSLTFFYAPSTLNLSLTIHWLALQGITGKNVDQEPRNTRGTQ